MASQVIFLGFAIYGMTVDPAKVKDIVEWLKPINIHEVRSFNDLTSFYRWFIRGFNTVTAPIIDCIRKWELHWTNVTPKIFKEIKSRMTTTPIMCLPNFSKVFEVACDAFDVGSQIGHPIAYFSEKLNEAKKKYSPITTNFM